LKKKREVRDYLNDILDNINKVLKFTSGIKYEEFIENDEKIYAVIRAIEIIGEAAKKVPDEMKAREPDIPWRDMAGIRDKVIHEYFGVDIKIVWITATKEIPPLKGKIEALIKALEKQEK
jgi:uncharacterized protein with HEPN domain